MRLVATRERYGETENQSKALMRKMSEHPEAASGASDRWSRAGYLFLMEKNPLGARYYIILFYCSKYIQGHNLVLQTKREVRYYLRSIRS